MIDVDKIIVKNDADIVEVNGIRKKLKTKLDEINEQRLGITRKMDESKKQVMDLFRPMVDFLSKADSAIALKIKSYLEEQDRLRRIEIAKQEELIRKQEAKIEAAKTLPTQIKAEAKAHELQMNVVSLYNKAPAVPTRTTYKAKVVNEKLLPREYLTPNIDMLNSIARSHKGGESHIPGVEFEAVVTVVRK